ncbi:rhodanese-like domain-containing protein [Yinghuangia sp. ASG 101]|uniref:rhodanese-like domain-containing protein n=1 Tax=Yinghuangia sp. ASG 101 TaxID=2896848 RepID=UPI001E5D4469|nr:rhodanese-like domain-containing protein [Yinghuangia sp. ASG 101]UGQ15239.1 rhodanese-like domain-containing protein [Yinghuangia sp. ASG 101]
MPQTPPAVTAAEVPADAYVLDVREDDEWRAGHVAGAVHIPMGTLIGRVDEVPKDRRVYVMCRVGGRSGQVTQYLDAHGWDVANIDGGMLAWESAGRPMVSESGADPFVA